ncbi:MULTISPECIES: LytTR family DNA-binding domain-containing protein [Staphylococcus]|uniref:LytTR family DNA-binding domain-containing protein n=1 Tax=Staphylococcus TaxID=1279 RepID=UPI00092861C9|nr:MULTISPECIES: LytTR family DNA-binding domain-containing protein [Staphylococcus]RNM25750.1 LytTR family transcriptional regulator [Staphylococcus cohnii]MBL0377769.1 LytTR family transcriptional regulator [Staphylococcus sp. S75]MBL0383031.1 LytTR family transcriptional regulator [Staphylococcus sp. S59]MBL0402209.1 LytTR family transcriptional regulator [Staphylococcus sp. S36]MDU9372074.1 LytTR family DNA-binding domain-containing protein [Staphylococcus ureilyticus]
MDVKVIYNQHLDNNQVIIEVNEHTEHVNDIVNYINKLAKTKLFPGKYKGETHFIKQEDIFSFRIENKILTMITADKQFTMNQRLYEIKSQINTYFLQISKSEIININYIDYLKLNKNGTIEIRFTNNDFTYSSRRYLPLIKEALKL